MDQQLDLTQIQGNIVPGFNKPHQAFLALRFADATPARAWLRTLNLTTAAEVVSFKADRNKALAEGRPPGSATWTNVAFTAAGIKLLLGSERSAHYDGFPWWFTRKGIFQRGGTSVDDCHALLLVGADEPSDLAQRVAALQTSLPGGARNVLACYEGHRLGDGREHFGFEDGVSQPVLAAPNAPNDRNSRGEPIEPGEFILGYPDQDHHVQRRGPDWADNGSYLVFWKLKQNVAAFRAALSRLSDDTGRNEVDIGESIVGRSADGQRLPKEPYAQFSHVGRAVGRSGGLPRNSKRRLLRRGIPYGTELAPGQVDRDPDRGLLFLAYQADAERQFDTLWLSWLNGAASSPTGSAPGRDPLVGQEAQDVSLPSALVAGAQPPGTRTLSYPMHGGQDMRITLAQFVEASDGGYFFAPSLKAVGDELAHASGPGH
jgi:Dyp-type peroxidase family